MFGDSGAMCWLSCKGAKSGYNFLSAEIPAVHGGASIENTSHKCTANQARNSNPLRLFIYHGNPKTLPY